MNRWRRRTVQWLVAALAVLVRLAAPVPAEAQAAGERVLVMPFENVTHDGRIVWLSEAAAVLLADDLNELGLQAITREERREAFERLQVPPAAALTDATVLRLGQLVGATSIVLGTVQMDSDTLVVEARHVVLDAARLRQRITERGPLNELFTTFERLARQMVPVTGRSRGEVQHEHPPVAAFESYIKGLVAENPKTAVTYLQASLDVDGAYDRARLALWDAFTDQGDHKAALAAVDVVPARAPLYDRARFLMGQSLMALQRYDEAFEVLRELLDRHPTPAVFNNLGVIQLRRGSTPQSGLPAYYFGKAADLDAADADVRFNLGYAYWAVRDAGAAIYWLREALRRNPADGEAHYVLGTALAAGGEVVEAQREKELARRLSSTFAEWDKRPASETVPKGLERMKDDIALPAARRADEGQAAGRDQAALVTFYVDRGRRFYEQGIDRDAAAELNRALFVSPYHPEANLLLGRVHQRSGRLAEAIAAYKIAIWSAETAAAHAALASAYLEATDVESAKTEAARAIALDPGSADAKQVLSRLPPP